MAWIYSYKLRIKILMAIMINMYCTWTIIRIDTTIYIFINKLSLWTATSWYITITIYIRIRTCSWTRTTLLINLTINSTIYNKKGNIYIYNLLCTIIIIYFYQDICLPPQIRQPQLSFSGREQLEGSGVQGGQKH